MESVVREPEAPSSLPAENSGRFLIVRLIAARGIAAEPLFTVSNDPTEGSADLEAGVGDGGAHGDIVDVGAVHGQCSGGEVNVGVGDAGDLVDGTGDLGGAAAAGHALDDVGAVGVHGAGSVSLVAMPGWHPLGFAAQGRWVLIRCAG